MNTDSRSILTLQRSDVATDLGLLAQTLRRLESRERHVGSPVDDLIEELDRLLAWLNSRIAQSDALLEVVEQVARGMLLEDVLGRIYDAFKSLIPYDRIGCALLNESGTKLRAYWARTEYPNVKIPVGFTAPLRGSSLEGVMVSREPRIINDLEAYLADHPDSVSTRLAVAEGIRSSLTCPLIAEGRPVGFLFFSSTAKGTYQNVHQETFQRIAAQVSLLVERSRLVQRVVDLNQNLQTAHGELLELSRRDSLTGLLHHGAIVGALEQLLSGCQRNLAVLMVDVDHFKRINDTHGHVVGDDVLRKVARILESAVRHNDLVGRYGGEEFLIVLDDATPAEALAIAERLSAAIPESIVVGEAPVTVSVGVADSTQAADAGSLVALADAALYQGKQSGRNRVVVAGG